MADNNQSQQARQAALNQAELARLSQSTGQVGKEELILAAMFGKQLQGDLNGIKKQAAEVGGGLKVSDVDMSKVMPSNILKAMGHPAAAVAGNPIPPQPVYQQPVPQPVPILVPQPDFQFIASPVQQVQVNNQPFSDPNQLEFDLNKQTQYEDIINAIDKLENKVNILTDKINTLIDSSNKKKPKITNGTQAG